MLSDAIACQRLQPIAGRLAEIFQVGRCRQRAQFAAGHLGQIARKALRHTVGPDRRRGSRSRPTAATGRCSWMPWRGGQSLAEAGLEVFDILEPRTELGLRGRPGKSTCMGRQ